MAKIVSIKRRLADQLYLPAIIRGLTITLRHFFVNLFTSREIETLRYGEWDLDDTRVNDDDPDAWRGHKKERNLPERYRGRHRLMKRDDGTVRCTACMMCATVCPANCITIEAGEREDSATSASTSSANRSVEKFPIRFEIDELVCVVCGFCVEACPCDALRMDTQVHVEPVERRDDAVFDREKLMSLGNISIARDGGESATTWREDYDAIEDLTQIYRPDSTYEHDKMGFRKNESRTIDERTE